MRWKRNGGDNLCSLTQRLSWHELRSPSTKPYEKWLLRFLVNFTVVDVANKLSITEEIVTGVLNRWLTTQVNWDRFQRIEILGIDEIALKRGHRDYVVLVTTPLSARGVEILAILKNRKKETVMNFFASIPIRLRNTIERVCTDCTWDLSMQHESNYHALTSSSIAFM